MTEAEKERAAVVAFIEETIDEALIALGTHGANNADQAVGSLGALRAIALKIERGDHLK